MRISKDNLVGVVVWYNPTIDNLQGIESYCNELDKLIIIDNSNVDNSKLLDNYRDVIYIPNFENKGIAFALNQGCVEALNLGAEWLLTMDQDSSFYEGGLSEFIRLANLYCDFDDVAIFSPIQHYRDFTKKSDVKYLQGLPEYQSLSAVMTSGNLLNLSVYKKTDGFLNDFFIDCVDDEYCCQLKRLNYDIVRINTVELNHALGNIKNVSFCSLNKIFIEHNAIRRYYIMRNNLYLRKMYPEVSKRCSRTIRKSIKRVILYDWDNKFQKMKMMYRGWRDYKSGIKGRLN